MSTTNSDSSTTDPNSASMLHGHVAYVSGAVKETIGNLTSSQPWQATGQADKSAAVDEMRAAKEASGANNTSTTGSGQNPTVGKIEELAGRAAGCEGMVEEGVGKQAKSGDF